MSKSFLIIWAVLLTIIIVATALKVYYDSTAKSIKRNLKKLGNPKGKTVNEVLTAMGNPSSSVRISSNKTVKKWTAKGYEVSFTFNKNNICTGISELE